MSSDADETSSKPDVAFGASAFVVADRANCLYEPAFESGPVALEVSHLELLAP